MSDTQVAIVTGGGTGIGRHIAERLARDRIAVALMGRDSARLHQTVAAIKSMGGAVTAIACDVRRVDQVKTAVDKVSAELGPVDVLVANAGIAGPTALCEQIGIDEWHDVFLTNLYGSFFLCRAVLPSMKARNRGSIVLIGSTTGKRAVPLRTPYAASKMALIGFGRALAAEVGPFGICVNTVCPGVVEGDRWQRVVSSFARSEGVSAEDISARYRNDMALRRFVQPQDVAGLVSYLITASSITGQDVNICGGLAMY